MDLQVEAVSNDIITPSSPTPNHLKTYNLSSLDLITPPILMPHVLFYSFDNSAMSIFDRTTQLKKSLSQVLTLFYPLAGRLISDRYINCNDEGVSFTQARANCNLSDFLNDPIIGEFDKFLPCALDDPIDQPMVIQATFFECGGLALGAGISHQVADGWSFFMFLKSWAAISRGEAHDVLPPIFSSATLFPPRDFGTFDPRSTYMKEKDIIAKRFVFSVPTIDAIKVKYTNKQNDGNSINPTRVEALSAFIWTRFIASTQPKDCTNKTHLFRLSVNMRTKFVPPLPKNSFGNIINVAKALLSPEDAEEGNHVIVEKMKVAIHEVGGDQATKLQEMNDSLSTMKDGDKKMVKGEVVTLLFASLCRFQIYNADFGLGKPLWVASARIPYKNTVFLLDSVLEGDIEAWVNLKRADMDKFEADEELRAYVSSSPHAKT